MGGQTITCNTKLTDGEWELTEPLLPEQGHMGRPRKTALRRIVDAMQYLPGTGYPSPFFHCPELFSCLVEVRVPTRMLQRLQDIARHPVGRSPSPGAGIIDS